MEKCNTEELYLLHRQRLLSLIQSKVEILYLTISREERKKQLI